MHLLYQLNKALYSQSVLIGCFPSYEKMCFAVGYEIADEADFGYEDDGGAFHQTEHQADMYASTFWQQNTAWHYGDKTYLFQRIDVSARELLKHLTDGEPVALLDEKSYFTNDEAIREREQRFFADPVKKYRFQFSPPGWHDDGTTFPSCEWTTFRPSEAEAWKAFDAEARIDFEVEADWSITVEELPITPGLSTIVNENGPLSTTLSTNDERQPTENQP